MPPTGRRKFRSQRRKKRKGFCGINKGKTTSAEAQKPKESVSQIDCLQAVEPLDEEPSSSSKGIEEPSATAKFVERENVSAKKLLNSSFEKYEGEGVVTRQKGTSIGLPVNKDEQDASGFKLQDATLLSECISSAAICGHCRSPRSKLKLFQRNNAREGLAESLFLKCVYCKKETPLKTSARLGGKGGGAHEVNRRSIISSYNWGRAGLSRFCAGMNLPPPVSKRAYNEHLKQILKASEENAKEFMQEAAKQLIDLVETKSPACIEIVDDERVANVAVTIDGTWQKRGHSSKIGVVFVISVLTGLILDYEVKLYMSNPKKLFCSQRDRKLCKKNFTMLT